MTPSKNTQDVSLSRQHDLIVRLVRITGALMMIGGLAIFADVGGLSAGLGLVEDGTSTILGGALMFAGMMDVILVPRLLEMVARTKR